jgi:hypothetical protein
MSLFPLGQLHQNRRSNLMQSGVVDGGSPVYLPTVEDALIRCERRAFVGRGSRFHHNVPADAAGMDR